MATLLPCQVHSSTAMDTRESSDTIYGSILPFNENSAGQRKTDNNSCVKLKAALI